MGKFLDMARPFADDPMSMDILHAEMIGEFIRRTGCGHVVEVGCCHGVSTGAVLDALDEREPKGHACLIDIKFTQTVLAMAIDFAGSSSLRATSSLERGVLESCASPNSIVILDGDHDIAVVGREVDLLLGHQRRNRMPRAIVFHDCGSVGGLPGPNWAIGLAARLYGLDAVIDDTPRPGMRTERGLGIVCRDEADEQIARSILCAKS